MSSTPFLTPEIIIALCHPERDLQRHRDAMTHINTFLFASNKNNNNNSPEMSASCLIQQAMTCFKQIRSNNICITDEEMSRVMYAIFDRVCSASFPLPLRDMTLQDWWIMLTTNALAFEQPERRRAHALAQAVTSHTAVDSRENLYTILRQPMRMCSSAARLTFCVEFHCGLFDVLVHPPAGERTVPPNVFTTLRKATISMLPELLSLVVSHVFESEDRLAAAAAVLTCSPYSGSSPLVEMMDLAVTLSTATVLTHKQFIDALTSSFENPCPTTTPDLFAIVAPMMKECGCVLSKQGGGGGGKRNVFGSNAQRFFSAVFRAILSIDATCLLSGERLHSVCILLRYTPSEEVEKLGLLELYFAALQRVLSISVAERNRLVKECDEIELVDLFACAVELVSALTHTPFHSLLLSHCPFEVLRDVVVSLLSLIPRYAAEQDPDSEWSSIRATTSTFLRNVFKTCPVTVSLPLLCETILPPIVEALHNNVATTRSLTRDSDVFHVVESFDFVVRTISPILKERLIMMKTASSSSSEAFEVMSRFRDYVRRIAESFTAQSSLAIITPQQSVVLPPIISLRFEFACTFLEASGGISIESLLSLIFSVLNTLKTTSEKNNDNNKYYDDVMSARKKALGTLIKICDASSSLTCTRNESASLAMDIFSESQKLLPSLTSLEESMLYEALVALSNADPGADVCTHFMNFIREQVERVPLVTIDAVMDTAISQQRTQFVLSRLRVILAVCRRLRNERMLADLASGPIAESAYHSFNQVLHVLFVFGNERLNMSSQGANNSDNTNLKLFYVMLVELGKVIAAFVQHNPDYALSMYESTVVPNVKKQYGGLLSGAHCIDLVAQYYDDVHAMIFRHALSRGSHVAVIGFCEVMFVHMSMVKLMVTYNTDPRTSKTTTKSLHRITETTLQMIDHALRVGPTGQQNECPFAHHHHSKKKESTCAAAPCTCPVWGGSQNIVGHFMGMYGDIVGTHIALAHICDVVLSTMPDLQNFIPTSFRALRRLWPKLTSPSEQDNPYGHNRETMAMLWRTVLLNVWTDDVVRTRYEVELSRASLDMIVALYNMNGGEHNPTVLFGPSFAHHHTDVADRSVIREGLENVMQQQSPVHGGAAPPNSGEAEATLRSLLVFMVSTERIKKTLFASLSDD